jgi:hypothetical protein
MLGREEERPSVETKLMTFVTKMTKKTEYQSGATRDTAAGKGRYDLLPDLAIRRVAAVYERGAANHGDRNWERGIPFSRLIDSALRHIAQYKMSKSDESLRDEDHIAHAVWNLLAVLHFESLGAGDLDDLPRYSEKPNSLVEENEALRKALEEEGEIVFTKSDFGRQ